jgi:hypothetical protein
VVTADALQTHADAAEFLVTGKHAHYLFTGCCTGRSLILKRDAVL